MLRKSDRVFLRNIGQMAYMNRAAAVIALKNAGACCHATAIKLHMNVEKMSEDKARAAATESGTAPLLQQAMAVRIFAEAVGGFEDLGSLCEAIRQRHTKRMFDFYGNSEREHNAFFEAVQSMTEAEELARYLLLPWTDDLTGRLSSDEIGLFQKQYEICFRQIKAAADLFLKNGETLPDKPDSSQHCFVVYEIVEAGKSPRKAGIMIKAYNKIKHRFLVFDDPDEMLQSLTDEGVSTNYKILPLALKDEDVDLYRQIAFGISQCMERLAALTLGLDEAEIELM